MNFIKKGRLEIIFCCLLTSATFARLTTIQKNVARCR